MPLRLASFAFDTKFQLRPVNKAVLREVELAALYLSYMVRNLA